MSFPYDGKALEPQSFHGTDDDVYKFIASIAWPNEREENRDSWAVTMKDRPDLLALEVKRARARLEAAIARVYDSASEVEEMDKE